MTIEKNEWQKEQTTNDQITFRANLPASLKDFSGTWKFKLWDQATLGTTGAKPIAESPEVKTKQNNATYAFKKSDFTTNKRYILQVIVRGTKITDQKDKNTNDQIEIVTGNGQAEVKYKKKSVTDENQSEDSHKDTSEKPNQQPSTSEKNPFEKEKESGENSTEDQEEEQDSSTTQKQQPSKPERDSSATQDQQPFKPEQDSSTKQDQQPSKPEQDSPTKQEQQPSKPEQDSSTKQEQQPSKPEQDSPTKQEQQPSKPEQDSSTKQEQQPSKSEQDSPTKQEQQEKSTDNPEKEPSQKNNNPSTDVDSPSKMNVSNNKQPTSTNQPSHSKSETPSDIETKSATDTEGNLVLSVKLQDVNTAQGTWIAKYGGEQQEKPGAQEVQFTFAHNKLVEGESPLMIAFKGEVNGQPFTKESQLTIEVNKPNPTHPGGQVKTTPTQTTTFSNVTKTSTNKTVMGGPLPMTANPFANSLIWGLVFIICGGFWITKRFLRS